MLEWSFDLTWLDLIVLVEFSMGFCPSFFHAFGRLRWVHAMVRSSSWETTGSKFDILETGGDAGLVNSGIVSSLGRETKKWFCWRWKMEGQKEHIKTSPHLSNCPSFMHQELTNAWRSNMARWLEWKIWWWALSCSRSGGFGVTIVPGRKLRKKHVGP